MNTKKIKITPMMRQYLQAKEDYPDCIVFFRMGDFYEVFYEDAHLCAAEVDLTLTQRDKGVPMAGMPHRAADGYINRLLAKGHRIAICEQLEDPSKAGKLVRRGVVRVITPGLVIDGEQLEAKSNNFLVALSLSSLKNADTTALACVDVSTGELRVCELLNASEVAAELRRLQPGEVVVAEGQVNVFESALEQVEQLWTARPDSALNLKSVVRDASASPLAIDERGIPAMSLGTSELRKRLAALDKVSFRDRKAVDSALGLLLQYLIATQGGVPAIIAAPQYYRAADYLILDPASAANLEIFETLMGGRKRGSLFSVLDHTVTAAGGRRLRTWLSYPLTDVDAINGRQAGVSELAELPSRRLEVRDHLDATSDIQRVCSRLAAGQGNARDLVTLRRTLEQIPGVKRTLQQSSAEVLLALEQKLDTCEDLVSLVAAAIVDEPPTALTEGELIRQGYHAELDELIELSRDGKAWLLRFEQQERERTGISSLKVKHNRQYGYFIEVTKANIPLVPEDYSRRQTLTNAERYFTEELKDYEDKILSAVERRNKLEYQLFEEVRLAVLAELGRLVQVADSLAELDALGSLAELSNRRDYVAPEVVASRGISIEEGRHPVVETMVEGNRFVPNGVELNDEEQLLLITGPNMAGKSTVIRQVALITLLAQIGSHVPAKRARIGVVDQIFSRVGASDNLARGQSTFMVEMSETAHILRSATEISLVILDEIGRGTATYDGLSIAWAVAEHLHDVLGSLTLFATHYHELTRLTQTRERVRNFNIAAKEWQDDIIFLHKLVEGQANRSYGVQVARLAGVPEEVVQRAREVLNNLEAPAMTEETPALAAQEGDVELPQRPQLSLFGQANASPSEESPILRELRELPLDSTTPLEALQWLYQMQKRAKRKPRKS